MNINKEEVNSIIQKYVDTKYPKKVIQYNNDLQKEKKYSLEQIANVTYLQNNLMWQDEEANIELQLNQLELKRYCRKLNLANRYDWRVPSYTELLTLLDYSRTNPASKKELLYVKADKYWSFTQSRQEKKKNWFINFEYGKSDIDSNTEKHNIRCVRNISLEKGIY